MGGAVQCPLVVMRQGVVAVSPLYVGHRVPVCECQLGLVVHLAQSLELGAPAWQPVINKPSFVIFLLLVSTGGDVSMRRGWAQWAEASCRRTRALHAPDVVGVRQERLAVVVRLPDDSCHVAFKVHVGARACLGGVDVAARIARLSVSAYMSAVVGVGWVAVVVGGGVLMVEVVVMVMWDAEVGGTWAAGGAGRVNLLLGAWRRFD